MPDAPYQRQLLVCTYGAWCRLEGADEIRAELKRLVKDAGLASDIRVTKSGCLGQCGHGPNAVVWPENVWYSGLKLEDARVLVEEHIQDGMPVERLRYHPPKAGTNKTPEVIEKEAKAHTKVD